MLAKSISGAAAAASPVFVEDTFSSYLYTGNGSTQTITNGIDLSGKGGLVWIKGRSGATGHRLTDTARGATKSLESNSAAAAVTESTGLTAFNGTGFSIGADADYNTNTATYVSWTFREQAKFFDVVTYTGTGANRTIAHNLGSAPGCIIVKCTSLAGTNWAVYHRSLTSAQYALQLNNTGAELFKTAYWNSTAPTSTVFSLGNDTDVNENGATYVAYLFAHDAGGFGLTGTDNVISCGSFGVSSGSDGVVTLGWEPQWVMFKQAQQGGSGNWRIVDNMRGCSTEVTSGDMILAANTSAAEADAGVNMIDFTATGFVVKKGSVQGGNPYIYIAIRRGPMKVPTSGTSVFTPTTFSTASGSNQTISSPQAIDMGLLVHAPVNGVHYVATRLIGSSATLQTQSTDAESTTTTAVPTPASQNAFTSSMFFRIEGGNQTNWNSTGSGTNCFYGFRRAPGFFDVVCYTGTGTSTAFNHNLTVAPEMIITKIRNSAFPNWGVWHSALSPSSAMLFLNTTGTQGNGYVDTVTSTTFSFATANGVVNSSGNTYVAYLFASVAGVSKIGSYTGTGTTKQIDCGFTGGARFVLIKRTDSTGDWYVWDSARGIVAGNDPYLLLNSTAAEVTNTDYIDTYSAGFEISSTAPAAINANGGTFIFLAIA